MKLPEALAEQFRKEKGHDPQSVVRALYDIQGRLGATYVAADDDSLTFFSRPSGGADSEMTLAWLQIQQVGTRTDGVFAFLELSTEQGPYVLRFSGWDKSNLDEIVTLWRNRPAAPKAPAPSIAPAPPTTPKPAPRPTISPLPLFCAAIQAMMECDHEIPPSELHFLASRIPDEQSIRDGREFLRRQGVDQVCQVARESLKDAQRHCLMANLISVAMVDGWLRSEELELLGRFQSALDISDSQRESLFAALMARNNMAVFPTDPPTTLPDADGLTPLIAFCASSLAMMEVDNEVTPQEREMLTLHVPYPEEIRLGEDFLHGYGLDHLLERLGAVLNPAQQRCLMANLIALVMVDGVIHSAEQALLDRFKKALNFSEDGYTALYEALLVKDNLSVFAS